MIGLERGKIKVLPYSEIWMEEFEKEKKRLAERLGPKVLQIEHVGSTAIPGVIAKPIIDILIGIKAFQDGFECVADLESLGYLYKGENGIERRHYFRTHDSVVKHHIHMFPIEHEKFRDHLLFRDCLRKNPQLVQEYSELKGRLQKKYPEDRLNYTEGKTELVSRILEKAKQEAGENE